MICISEKLWTSSERTEGICLKGHSQEERGITMDNERIHTGDIVQHFKRETRFKGQALSGRLQLRPQRMLLRLKQSDKICEGELTDEYTDLWNQKM